MANIIQQFKDADGNNIYPIAYAAGGVKMDLLWTNPAPTSNFAAQTVSLDLSEYDLLLIAISYGLSMDSLSYNIMPIGQTANLNVIKLEAQASRFVTATTSGVTFQGGYVNNTASTSAGIPCYIYGIKMSYIVPTTVQGLQYVEVN